MSPKPPLPEEEVARILGLLEPLSVDRSIVLCAREWSRYLLDDDPSPERVRAVLRINERIFRKCIHDMHFRAAETVLEVDAFQAVLAEHEALPPRFHATRYPQMCERLEDQRARAKDSRT